MPGGHAPKPPGLSRCEDAARSKVAPLITDNAHRATRARLLNSCAVRCAALRVTSLRARALQTLPVIRPALIKEDSLMTTQKITLAAVEDDGAVRWTVALDLPLDRLFGLSLLEDTEFDSMLDAARAVARAIELDARCSPVAH